MSVFSFNKIKSSNAIDIGTRITGDIHSENSWTISGNLTGDLTTMGSVTIEKNAEVKGNITGESVRIAGKIVGNVTAKKALYLVSSCSVDGDISYQTIEIEDGAHYSGQMHTDTSSIEGVSGGDKHQITTQPPQEQPTFSTKNKRIMIQ